MNVMRGLALEGALVSVLDALKDANIEVALLKGVHQQRAVHGRMGARRLSDNDVLVHRRDVAGTAKVLETLNYRPVEKWRLEEALGCRHEFSFVLEKSGAILPLDLHWRVAPEGLLAADEDTIWGEMQRSDIRGRSTLTPSFALGILIAAYQVLAHLESGDARTRELALWWNKSSSSERDQAHRFAEKVGCSEVLNVSLRAAWHLGALDDEPPASTLGRIDARAIAGHMEKGRLLRGPLMLAARLIPWGPRRSLAYLWSRVWVSSSELPITAGATSTWSRMLGPRVGRVVNALVPRA